MDTSCERKDAVMPDSRRSRSDQTERCSKSADRVEHILPKSMQLMHKAAEADDCMPCASLTIIDCVLHALPIAFGKGSQVSGAKRCGQTTVSDCGGNVEWRPSSNFRVLLTSSESHVHSPRYLRALNPGKCSFSNLSKDQRGPSASNHLFPVRHIAG